MQVILVEQVKNLGNLGDKVEVKAGYARNYLIPNKKALRATKDNIAYFESKRAEIEKTNSEKSKSAESVSKKIDGKLVTLIRQAGEDGRLYGSVSAANISDSIKEELKIEMDRKNVHLHQTIKYIGIYSVEIGLHGEISAKLNVNVARNTEEAADAKKRFAKGEKVMEGPGGETKDQKAQRLAKKETEAKEEKAEEVQE